MLKSIHWLTCPSFTAMGHTRHYKGSLSECAWFMKAEMLWSMHVHACCGTLLTVTWLETCWLEHEHPVLHDIWRKFTSRCALCNMLAQYYITFHSSSTGTVSCTVCHSNLNFKLKLQFRGAGSCGNHRLKLPFILTAFFFKLHLQCHWHPTSSIWF